MCLSVKNKIILYISCFVLLKVLQVGLWGIVSIFSFSNHLEDEVPKVYFNVYFICVVVALISMGAFLVKTYISYSSSNRESNAFHYEFYHMIISVVCCLVMGFMISFIWAYDERNRKQLATTLSTTTSTTTPSTTNFAKEDEINENHLQNSLKYNIPFILRFGEQHPIKDLITIDDDDFSNGNTFNTPSIEYVVDFFYHSYQHPVFIIFGILGVQILIMWIINKHNNLINSLPVEEGIELMPPEQVQN